MKYTDYAKVRELSRDLKSDYKAMLQYTLELLQELKTLEGTFLDDGIDPIKEYVAATSKKLVSTAGDVETVAKQLGDYADLLEKTKS